VSQKEKVLSQRHGSAMRRIFCLVSAAVLAPLLTNCGGGDAILARNNDNLAVSPSSVVLSASAGGTAAFTVTDASTSMSNVTFSPGTCNGIASYQGSAAGVAGHAMTVIGQAPNVGGSGSGSAYGVSAVAEGTCTLRISDTLNNVATIFVTVTK
jgi:hypothetical protein